jgi:glycosyltransferase involved in cell wall biosynthesis
VGECVKIALVHDYLCGVGGSDRIFQYLCEEFIEADVYTLAYNPSRALPYFKNREIHATWLNKIIQSPDAFRLAFPIATYVMQHMDFSRYDVVLSSSATTAKYITVPHGIHVCYCYIPTRAIWHYEEYFGKGINARVFALMLPYLRRRDYQAAQKVDKFIAISNASKDYIKEYYHRDAVVINCPIETDKFHPSTKKKEHFLLVSRLEYWKKVDFAVEAFNKLGLPLRIIGTGKEECRLREMAKSNITFLGEVDDTMLAREYSEARAVVFTPHLEYGLIPLEANASGTPVICLGKGGVTEIMVPSRPDAISGQKPTAVFFYEQTADALAEAVLKFERYEFSSADLVTHAAQWSVPAFKSRMRGCINKLI